MDPGAVWEDFRIGFAHLTGWERDSDCNRHRMDPPRRRHFPVPRPR
jgi:hypothetical protein